VVEIELNLNIGVYSGFITGELKLFDKVFVRTLCETPTLIGIEVNVIDEESSGSKRRDSKELIATNTTAKIIIGACNKAFRFVTEFNIDTDFVILKSNKRKGKSRVAAEPELKRNVKSSSFSLRKTSSG